VRVTAVVIAWNPGERIDDCLRALRDQTHDDFQVIVVDNASTDGTADLVAERHPWSKLVANGDNRGFAGAANQAWELAGRTSDAFMTVNPDIVASPAFVGRLVAVLERHHDVGSVAGLLLRPDGTIDSTGHVIFDTRLFRNRGEGDRVDDDPRYTTAQDVFGTTGAAAMYRRVALEDAAAHDPAGTPWDEGCFAFWEDVDLDWRLQRLGWRCRYEPSATATHERGVARRAASSFVEELNWRNRFRTIWRNDDPGDFVRHVPQFAFTTLLKGGDLLLTHPGAFVRGTLGLRLGRRPRGRRTAPVVTQRFDYARWIRSHLPVSGF
jgi:GT2 family glycosyltransferase